MDEIVIDKPQIQHGFSTCLSYEWLECNGLGDYASSSIVNCHTRKYHGLLVSELVEPPGKFVLLSHVQDSIVLDNHCFNLFVANYYGDQHCDPHMVGYPYFKRFRQGIAPCFEYQCGLLALTKQVMMLPGENTVLIHYECHDDLPGELRFNPLLAMRDFHQLMRANDYINADVGLIDQGISISPYQGMPTLYIQVNIPFEFNADPCWYYQFDFPGERARGFAAQEDNFSPGIMTVKLGQQKSIIFSISTSPHEKISHLWRQENKRRQQCANMLSGTALQQRLRYVARTFLRDTPQQQRSVIAGYHWFLDWGRDAMIALPGLTLCTDRADECLQVLRYFSSQQREGLLPNFISATEGNSYDTVDASLWFTVAVQQYYQYTQNLEAIKRYLWQPLCEIFRHYCQGTAYQIHLSDQHLIWAGSEHVKVSWMDAVVDGVPVTPRYGYQVEINALWYNFLMMMHDLAVSLDDKIAAVIKPMLNKTKRAFQTTFWCPEVGYCYDYVNDNTSSMAIRPNQLFAISLPHSPLNKQQATKVLNVVKQHLYTPVGLRTLAVDDGDYVGRYQGGSSERDSAYHQGTVWPWLLGHFSDALIRWGSPHQIKTLLETSIAAMDAHLCEHGIGSIAEIFDGDALRQPHGCISQAWSVAEVLRMTCLFDVYMQRGSN